MRVTFRILLSFGLALCGTVFVSAQGWSDFSLPDSPEQSLSELPLALEDILPEREAVLLENGGNGEGFAPSSGTRLDAARRKALELDRLFMQLKQAAKVEEAATLNRQIQELWAQSGSDTVDLLMKWVEEAITDGDYVRAVDFLDNVVALKPDFAEGWMRRASVHIQRHDLTLAMLDLNRVMQLEPRHYHAMSQLGMIMEMTDRNKSAMKIYEKALSLYPQFVRLQKRVDRLLEQEEEHDL